MKSSRGRIGGDGREPLASATLISALPGSSGTGASSTLVGRCFLLNKEFARLRKFIPVLGALLLLLLDVFWSMTLLWVSLISVTGNEMPALGKGRDGWGGLDMASSSLPHSLLEALSTTLSSRACRSKDDGRRGRRGACGLLYDRSMVSITSA